MITESEVRHIAELARIGLDEEEIEKYTRDLSVILDWMGQMNEVDVKDVVPTAHIGGIKNAVREDKEKNFPEKERISGLFPERKNGYDKVKSVM